MRVLRTEIRVAAFKATLIAFRGTRGSFYQKKDDETTYVDYNLVALYCERDEEWRWCGFENSFIICAHCSKQKLLEGGTGRSNLCCRIELSWSPWFWAEFNDWFLTLYCSYRQTLYCSYRQRPLTVQLKLEYSIIPLVHLSLELQSLLQLSSSDVNLTSGVNNKFSIRSFNSWVPLGLGLWLKWGRPAGTRMIIQSLQRCFH